MVIKIQEFSVLQNEDNNHLINVYIIFCFTCFQLNDVKVGGATVFPSINARVPVKKVSQTVMATLFCIKQ